MARGAALRLSITLLAGVMLSGCSDSQETFTSPVGTVDKSPNSFWGDRFYEYPPAIDGGVFDPTDGIGVQRFADELIGKRVATFVELGWDPLRRGPTLNSFFTQPEIGPG